MSDYRVKITVRNAHILRAIESAGYRSVAQFCEVESVSYGAMINLIAMREPPIGKRGTFSATAQSLMGVLCLSPVELWTERQLSMSLPRSSVTRDVGEDCMESLSDQRYAQKLLETTRLSPREKSVIAGRFVQGKTLHEAGESLGVSVERVRQIELKAMRKLRNKIADEAV